MSERVILKADHTQLLKHSNEGITATENLLKPQSEEAEIQIYTYSCLDT